METAKRISDIKESLMVAEKYVADFVQEGIKQGWTKDGSISKFWPFNRFKSGDRLEWEMNLTFAQQELANKQKYLIELESQL